MAYNMPSPSTPSPALYAPGTAQPPAAVAPFQTLFGGASPAVAAYSPKVSRIPAHHSTAAVLPVCSCDYCGTALPMLPKWCHAFSRTWPVPGQHPSWGSTCRGRHIKSLCKLSEADPSATAGRTSATNLRLRAASCTATSVLHDASQPRSDNAGGLQRSHAASLHRHCPHLRTTSCEGGSSAQMHCWFQLPASLLLHSLFMPAVN